MVCDQKSVDHYVHQLNVFSGFQMQSFSADKHIVCYPLKQGQIPLEVRTTTLAMTFCCTCHSDSIL